MNKKKMVVQLTKLIDKKTFQAVWKGGGNMGGGPFGPKEIDGLLVLPSKVSMLLRLTI